MGFQQGIDSLPQSFVASTNFLQISVSLLCGLYTNDASKNGFFVV
ncbi:MAG: hypothetical protein AAF802_24585 [Planctomycetota bacterium]